MELWLYEKQTPNLSLGIRVKETIYRGRSGYQDILLVESFEYGRVLFLDGTFQTTEKDEFIYHEMITHVGLCCQPKPENVLIIGGGDGGTLREVLKHKCIKKATLVEIDEKVVEVSKRYLPFYESFKNDKRFEIVTGDGIEYVRSRKGVYDLIIVDSTDPVGPAKGLFTERFYQDCFDALTDTGIIVAQSESPYLHLELIREISWVLRKIFPIYGLYLAPIPTYPSGLWSFSAGSKRYRPDHIMREPDFSTRYYTPDVHRASFMLPGFLRDAII